MKEFIEKLIERLEEEKVDIGEKTGFSKGINKSIEIVNELAEEYIPCTKPCTDCEAYDLVKHNCPKFCKVIKETVEELAEEYNNGWIPCSERLPKSNGWYLVTNVLEVVQQQYWGASHWQKLRDEAVIAWMPLPQPYTEEQKELSTTWQQQTMNRFERVE